MNDSKEILEGNQEIIEEHIVNSNGKIGTQKYAKGHFLGKGGFAKCYEFVNLDTKEICAAKIIDKATLTKNRAKQKVFHNVNLAYVRNSYT